MTSLEVFVDDNRININEEDIALTKNFINIEDLSKWRCDNSNTINFSRLENKKLNFPNKISSPAFNTAHKLTIAKKGFTIFNGKCLFTSSNSIVAISADYDILKDLSDTNMRDISYATDDYILTVSNCLNAGYALARLSAETKEIDDLQYMLPTRTTKEIFEAISNHFNITFDNLITADNPPIYDLILTDNNFIDPEFKIKMESVSNIYSRSVGTSLNSIPFDDNGILNFIDFYTLTDTFNRLTTTTTFNTTNFATSNISLRFTMTLNLKHSGDLDEFYFRRNSVEYQFGNLIISDDVDGVNQKYTFEVNETSVSSVYDLVNGFDELGVFYAKATETDTLYIWVKELIIEWLPNEERDYNRLISVSSTMPDVSCLDFIKSMAFLEGKHIVSIDDNNLSFNSISEVIANEAFDISQYVDINSLIVSEINNVGSISTINLAGNNDIKIACNSGRGKTTYLDINTFNCTNLLYYAETGKNLVNQPIMEENSVNDDKSIYICNRSSTSLKSDLDISFNSQGVSSYIAGDTLPILTQETEFEEDSLFDLLRLNRKITCKAVLPMTIYKSLTQFIPIYLNINDNSGYFYLNKISNYKENEACTIELIKLY